MTLMILFTWSYELDGASPIGDEQPARDSVE